MHGSGIQHSLSDGVSCSSMTLTTDLALPASYFVSVAGRDEMVSFKISTASDLELGIQ